MATNQRERAWQRVIGATRRKFNLGWWLEMLAPLSIGFGVLAASSLLYLRTQLWVAEHLDLAAIIAGGTLLLLPIIALIAAKRRFITSRQAAVRLESEMGLHNALTAAEQELSPWPSTPLKPRIRDGFSWNWSRLVIPPVIAVALVAVAFLIPVQPIEARIQTPNEPHAWENMEAWAEELKEKEIANEEKVEEVLRQIESLRDQPEDNWFKHSSLEATDNLQDYLSRSVSEMEKNMSTAERSLGALEKYSDMMSEAARDQLIQEFNEALKNLEFGDLPPTQEMLDKMHKMDPEQMRKQMNQMNAEQRQQLRQALRQNAQALKKIMAENGMQPGGGKGKGKGGAKGKGKGGKGKGEGLEGWGEGFEDEEAIMRMMFGENWRQQMNQPGNGGIQRGPGDAPMFHNDEETELGTKNLKGVKNKDISRAAPGDILGVGIADHEIDEKTSAAQKAGAVKSTGKGGEAVWESDLLPSERKVLERYFKD